MPQFRKVSLRNLTELNNPTIRPLRKFHNSLIQEFIDRSEAVTRNVQMEQRLLMYQRENLAQYLCDKSEQQDLPSHIVRLIHKYNSLLDVLYDDDLLEHIKPQPSSRGTRGSATTLTFLDEKSGGRSYYVKLNGEKLSIPYSEMALLIYLAIKRKAGDGLVSQDDTDREGITESEMTEGRLRKLVYNLQKSLRRKDLIVNECEGFYRLTIFSDSILVPEPNWLEDTLCEILAHLEKYRE